MMSATSPQSPGGASGRSGKLWLEQEPGQTAKDLPARLVSEHPDAAITEAQLRTLQRRVKRWRSDKARQLLFARQTNENGCDEYDPTAGGR